MMMIMPAIVSIRRLGMRLRYDLQIDNVRLVFVCSSAFVREMCHCAERVEHKRNGIQQSQKPYDDFIIPADATRTTGVGLGGLQLRSEKHDSSLTRWRLDCIVGLIDVHVTIRHE